MLVVSIMKSERKTTSRSVMNKHDRSPVCASAQCTVCAIFFFFQAEDGIRDLTVTGVQTCALPIYDVRVADDGAGEITGPQAVDRIRVPDAADVEPVAHVAHELLARDRIGAFHEIGRASCRERV